MTNPVIWVHGDCLRPTNPALEHTPSAPALFVWDDELLAQYHISLKRLVFMYEALLEMPVTIMRGNVPEQVCAFAEQHAASHIITTHSVAPRFADHLQHIRRRYRVEVLKEEPFVDIPIHTDIRRFSRYWVAAAKSLRDSS
jgi:hypothetical protein